jgi:hypothetical protein
MNKKAITALLVIVAVCIAAIAVIYTLGLNSTPPAQPPTGPLLGANGPIGASNSPGPIGVSPTP